MNNTNKFTGKASLYERYRPSYPEEYIDYLVERCKLTGKSSIADIGAGTGILTKQLIARNLQVVGIEPNDDMRAHAELHLIKGTAEQTGLKEGSLDLITVAQAFHWFNHEAFKVECKRILKHGGEVALVWNSRDFTNPLTVECDKICKELCHGFKGFSGGIEETPEVYANFFKGGVYENKVFENPILLDLEGFLGRYLSASYAPKENEENYRLFKEKLTALYYQYAHNQHIVFPNLTRSYIGSV